MKFNILQSILGLTVIQKPVKIERKIFISFYYPCTTYMRGAQWISGEYIKKRRKKSYSQYDLSQRYINILSQYVITVEHCAKAELHSDGLS